MFEVVGFILSLPLQPCREMYAPGQQMQEHKSGFMSSAALFPVLLRFYIFALYVSAALALSLSQLVLTVSCRRNLHN